MKFKAFVFSCPIKTREHTNSDGSKVQIRQFAVDERSFWDELTNDWIKSEQKDRTIVPTECEVEWLEENITLRIVCDPETFVELYREHYDKAQQKMIRTYS